MCVHINLCLCMPAEMVCARVCASLFCILILVRHIFYQKVKKNEKPCLLLSYEWKLVLLNI